MLDAFIINRIREPRDERGARQVPLRIEIDVPQPPPEHEPRKEDAEGERGIAIIDFNI